MKNCMKCGGSTKKKMATGGSMKTTVGKATPKGQIYGIPQTGPTGPNYQGVNTMRKGGAIKKMQDGGKTGAQLKKEGAAMKAKGQAMKAEGARNKEYGKALKTEGQNPSKGMYDELTTRTNASQIKLRESNVFGYGTGTKPSDRSVADQKVLDKDMAIIRAKEARDKRAEMMKADLKKVDKKKVADMQSKGGYSKTSFKTGGMVKKTKFAALAPPYNKATFADKIVGAKKNAKKK